MKSIICMAGLSAMLLNVAVIVHADDRTERGERVERQSHTDNRNETRQRERAAVQERQFDVETRQSPSDIQFQAESGKRFGHLTADERRALRRQINEAGQDIYTRRH